MNEVEEMRMIKKYHANKINAEALKREIASISAFIELADQTDYI